MFRKAVKQWKQYRYRFVPWIVLNLKNRKVRSVDKSVSDQIISDEEASTQLCRFLNALDRDRNGEDSLGATKEQTEPHKFMPNPCSKCGADADQVILRNPQDDTDNECKSSSYDSGIPGKLSKSDKLPLDVRWENAEEVHRKNKKMNFAQVAGRNLNIMHEELGYAIERKESRITGGGRGVEVTRGRVLKHRIVAMYPGTLYYPSEPIFFQSLGNPFIFRCIDGVLIDGNDKGISKVIYRSCSNRDRIGPYMLCDQTWLTENTINPMAIGQYVNNQTSGYPANVAYQEYDLPIDFPFELRKYIPYVHYSPSTQDHQERTTRIVLLVSLRDIEQGEELLSTYFTVVH